MLLRNSRLPAELNFYPVKSRVKSLFCRKSSNYCFNLFLFLSVLFNTMLVLDIIQVVAAESEPLNSRPEKVLFQFYRDYISPADGERCGMSPSCSGYGEQAIKKHGFFMGLIMSCDRLIRCGRDECYLSPTVQQPDGKLLTSDPVQSNDFWWYPNATSD